MRSEPVPRTCGPASTVDRCACTANSPMVPGYPLQRGLGRPSRRPSRRRLMGCGRRAAGLRTRSRPIRQIRPDCSRDSERKAATWYVIVVLYTKSRRRAPARGHRGHLGSGGNPADQLDSLERNQALLRAWVASHRSWRPRSIFLSMRGRFCSRCRNRQLLTAAARGCCLGHCWRHSCCHRDRPPSAMALFLAVRYHLADAIAHRSGRFLGWRPAEPAARCSATCWRFVWCRLPLLAGQPWGRTVRHAAAAIPGRHAFRRHSGDLRLRSVGAGVGGVLATGGAPDLAVIFSPSVLGPLLGLAALALLPVVWRKWRQSDA